MHDFGLFFSYTKVSRGHRNRSAVADEIVSVGDSAYFYMPVISVQVLSETANIMRRKLGFAADSDMLGR